MGSSVVYALMDLDEEFNKSGSEDFTPLQWASLAGKSEVVEYLLDHDEDTRKPHELGWSHLHQVVESGGVKATRILIQRGAAVDARDDESRTPLHLAAAKNHDEVAQVLVDSGADINILNKNQETPLHECARSNAHSVANALIEKGADVSFADSCSSLIHMCANYDSIDVARLILETKVDKDAKGGKDEETALHICAQRDHYAVAELLLQNGANVQARDVRSRTPLHTCACSGNVSMAELLMKYDCNVNPLDHSNNTPLHLCQDNGVAVARCLLDHGANDEARNTDDDTPLHVVSKHRQIKLTRVLVGIRDGWEVAATDGFDALHWASAADNVRVVKMLLNHPKTDISQIDSKGRNALDIAVHAKNVAAAKALVGLDDTWSTPGMMHFTPLHWCAVANNVNLLKQYLEDARPDINTKDSMGRTALHLTGLTNGYQCADILMNAGASAEMQAKNGDPPLFTAYYYKSRDVFSRLIGHICDVTSRDGETIVHIAARLDDSKTINRLLSEGDAMFKVLVTKTNNKGDSALHVAASENSVEAATVLLQGGADTCALNSEKKKPMDLVGEKWKMLYLLQEADVGSFTNERLGEIHQRVADGDDTLIDKELIDNCSTPGSEGVSILHVAVINSRYTLVKRLLDMGINLNVQDNNGRSPLHLATRQFRLNITQMLLQRESCDVDIKDKLGRSPLHWAAKENSFMLIECLLNAGANASLQAEDHKTPVHILLENKIDNEVKKRENEESISLLLNHIHGKEGQEATADLAASALSSLIMSENHQFRTEKISHVLSKVKGHARCFSSPCYLSNHTKGLLKEVSERWSRYTVFMALVEYYTPEMLGGLLRLTTEETIKSTNFLQQNTLHLLAEKHVDDEGHGSIDKVSILTKNGLDPRHRYINGRTPLHVACQHQDLQLVRFLLDSFRMPDCLGSLNSKDIMGRTALHHLIRDADESSEKEGWQELINQFISLGADPNLCDFMGESALECGYDRQVDSIIAHTGFLPMTFPQITGPKIGLLEVDTNNELPTSLGGNNVANEHDINVWISSLRTKYASNTATDYFLKSTRFGPVGKTYTNRANAERISRFVTEVCQTTLSRMHVKGHIELSGSMAEGTKVGPVDEMDFLLRLTDMEESVKITGIECTGGSPFAKLSTNEGDLKSAEKALDVLESFLQSLRNLSSLPGFGISLEDVKRNKLKVFTLVLKCAQRSSGDLLVTIDLVPCIMKEFGYHPSWQPSVRRVSEEGCDVTTCPLLMKKDGFEVSFSELEHKAVREMELYQRNAYILLKAMRTEEICPRLTSMKVQESIEDIIPSYIFKICLLWIVDPERKRAEYLDFAPEDLSELSENEKIRHLAIEVLNLVSTSTRDTIPSYFCPSTKLRLTHNCKLLCQIIRGVLNE